MHRSFELTFSPAEAADAAIVRRAFVALLGEADDPSRIHVRVRRRSVDARSKHPLVLLRADVYVDEAVPEHASFTDVIPRHPQGGHVIIIGAGPAGLEAARVGAERGHEVIVYEAAAKVGGQIRLTAQSPMRREMLAIEIGRAHV